MNQKEIIIVDCKVKRKNSDEFLRNAVVHKTNKIIQINARTNASTV